MQHIASSTLSWSERQQVYELSAAKHHEVLRMTIETPAWFAWLDEVSSFAFHGQHGSFTARKETKQRGSVYWYAYRKREGTLAKKYLGKTTDLTFTRLEDIAGVLHADRATAARPPEPASSPLAPHETVLSHAHADESRVASSPVLTPHAPPNTHGDPLAPLLATKLHLPRPRAQLVPRFHLVERLQQGVTGALTLVSAPAGFGKTTLLAQWQASTRAPVAWLSLEPEDNESIRFLTYLIAALQTLDPHLGARALALLGLPQPAEPETVLALLANDLIGWQGEDFALVLDDYYVITAEPIHRALTYLVEHLPPQMHLIIATRSDPPLPLARLRARGQLTELRAAELRFRAAEAGAFLEEVMGLHLSPQDVTTLQTRTEGWIAGLQLAALSLQGRADVSAFLAAFTGSHRYVLDYLSEEVLVRQPAPVQQFLLHTSILDRLSGPLCDAVTEQEGSQAMLEALERANLFVAALDDEREWYRYHHLFADLLRSRLHQTVPALLPELHRRASTWYEQHDLIIEAVHHARLSPDVERTIRLIEQYTHSLALRGQVHTVLNWLSSLPDGLVRTHPRLCLSQALLLLFTGQLEEALMRLQEAEQSASQLIPADEAQTFLNRVATTRAYILFLQGDLASSVALAEQALERLTETQAHGREVASVIAAHRGLISGDVRHVGEQRAARLASPRSAGDDVFAEHMFMHLDGILLQARLFRLQGRLRRAAATYEQMAQVQGDHEGALIHPGYCFGLGELCYEWNDLDAAERLLQQGMEVLRGPLPLAAVSIAQGYATLARLRQARKQNTSALALVDAFARLADARQFAPAQLAFASAVRAQLELMQGNLAAAVRWTEASGLSALDDLTYPHRLLRDADAKARMDSVLEILMLRALTLEAQGNRTGALSTLERALVLAEPEGYIRLFIDEGPLMWALLRHARGRGIVPGYVATLLAAFGEQHTSDLPPPSPRSSVLLEPLTERERDVLRLLLEGASNREIAHRLVLSVNTVKRHVYNLCGKLGVQSRAQAIIRARDLNLL